MYKKMILLLLVIAACIGAVFMTACDDTSANDENYSDIIVESISPNNGSYASSCSGFVLSIKFSGALAPTYGTVVIGGNTYDEGDYLRTIISDPTGYYQQLSSFNPDIVLPNGDLDKLGIKIYGFSDTEGIPLKTYSDPDYSLGCDEKE